MSNTPQIKQPKASYRYGYGMMGAGQHAGQEYKVVMGNGQQVGGAGGGFSGAAQAAPGAAVPGTPFGSETTTANFNNQQPGVVTGGQAPQPAQQQAQKSNPNSTQNSLQVAEIREGIVVMMDGTFRAVIMAKAINFDLMSQGEQEGIEYAYQGFLNSLFFPVQIFIRSQKVDLQPYIEKLDKIRSEHDNMLLALLMEDYIGYIDNLSKETNIMDKKFYVVIPFATSREMEAAFAGSKSFFQGLGALFSSSKGTTTTISEMQMDKAKTELRNRVQAVLQGLSQCGIKALPLDTEELIELYYDMYNPDTATRQQIKNFEDLTAEIITKGEGMAPQAHLQGELD